jgi:hypothetical protein
MRQHAPSVALWRVRWTASIPVGMFAVFVVAGRGGSGLDLLFLDQHPLLVHCLYGKFSQASIFDPFWHCLSSVNVCSSLPYSCLFSNICVA